MLVKRLWNTKYIKLKTRVADPTYFREKSKEEKKNMKKSSKIVKHLIYKLNNDFCSNIN